MKRIVVTCLFAVGVIAVLGCQSDELNQSGAQTAVAQGFEQTVKPQLKLPSNSTAVITGIVQNNTDNTATADLAFRNATFDNYPMGPCELRGGKAIFQHYTDGRWVLTTILTTSANGRMCAGGRFHMNIQT